MTTNTEPARPALTWYVDWYGKDDQPNQEQFSNPDKALGFVEALWRVGFHSAELTMGANAYA